MDSRHPSLRDKAQTGHRSTVQKQTRSWWVGPACLAVAVLVGLGWWFWRSGPSRLQSSPAVPPTAVETPASPPLGQLVEAGNWAGVLAVLANDPLTNAARRLYAVRALAETGRLPTELFTFFHTVGPELLAARPLRAQRAMAHAADTVLELGHLNLAERWAFDSLEMEGETPAVLRLLVRIHLLKDLPRAAEVFANRLALATGKDPSAGAAWLAAEAPAVERLRTNLVTTDEVGVPLTTETVLRRAWQANPRNRMAFEFLMAHYLLTRQLPAAMEVLAAQWQGSDATLPRHYAEAVVLFRHLQGSAGLARTGLAERVPPAVEARFRAFAEQMQQAGSEVHARLRRIARDFANTYWFYHYFGHLPVAGSASHYD